ncbi:hypothetical protein CfE428DRAFT_4217 [Chthoniobacter flavus Ellin428]|uniref:Uncharacterized protein n=1 Tax=Chthoniobacter flavus Ellin428 TaxID=497964 RepID=B4D5M8_9BACT|nr:hypothetical protein CfE428DRAFT_4217 [Chthoniobacter flavus Ellin428]TCO90858.1 hypothetical protein EV701_1097 [Chthoniobacter flavus]
MSGGVERVETDRSFDQDNGFRVSSFLVLHYSQKMQCFRMIWIYREELTINCLGLGYASEFMM